MIQNWEVIQFFQMNICKIENTICQQPFQAIANFVVSSRLRFARIFIFNRIKSFPNSKLTSDGKIEVII